ncbi:prepilin peptidase [Photobacterium aquimaris]|uniref:Prepilin leader peptidase/N-methyltransferase n=1 Tax=Photobacterium aquimaris TaxID=512643 RepID=A0A1Y6KYJ4_9GAMM|nr:A24 family peptidase [Photobacterium aquimaris]SMY17239.1 Type 4 prepilin-like proteins leader peptide-processing enzyme [Photobacterium aquimaris]
MAVLSYYPWLYPLFATILGLLIGSFLNVVIYRLPIMMERQWRQECQDCFPELDNAQANDTDAPFNLSVPRSRCPHCNHAITALENIPLISWLVLKGKCRECHAPISKRYPAIELLTAIISLIVALVLPPTWWAVAVLGCSFALIALTFIDIDKMLLPDQITLPLMWAGILLAVIGISPLTLTDAVIGAMAGYLSLWSVFWAFKLLTKKDGMGYGDFKLLAAIGAWVGWSLLPFVVLLSSFVGAICGIIMLRTKGEDQQTPFSFGPYLAVAGWIAILWGQPILHWYVSSYLGF